MAILLNFPGAIFQAGTYAEERKIFDSIAVAVQEVPLDILALILSFSFQTLIPRALFDSCQSINARLALPKQPQTEYLTIMWVFVDVLVLISSLVYYRRVRLGRL